MRQAFVYRLSSSRTQERTIEAIFTTTHSFSHKLPAERKEAWEERGERVSRARRPRRMAERKATNLYVAFMDTRIARFVADEMDKVFLAFSRHVHGREKEPAWTGGAR